MFNMPEHLSYLLAWMNLLSRGSDAGGLRFHPYQRLHREAAQSDQIHPGMQPYRPPGTTRAKDAQGTPT